MSKTILGFKTFSTEIDFINWQKEDDRNIAQVSPLVFSMKANISETETAVHADVNAGCFVLYSIEL